MHPLERRWPLWTPRRSCEVRQPGTRTHRHRSAGRRPDGAGPLGARISLFFARAVPRLRRRRSLFPGVAARARPRPAARSRPSPRRRCSCACCSRRPSGCSPTGSATTALVIVTLAWSALALALGLSLVAGFWPILVVGVAFLLAIGTMLPLIETVAVAGVRTAGLDYGRMRLWGSITFIVANFAGGVLIEALGGGFGIWLIASRRGARPSRRRTHCPPPPVASAAARRQRVRALAHVVRRRGCCARACSSVPRRHRLHARRARDVLHFRRAALAGAGPVGGVGRHAVGDRRHGRGGAVRVLGARRAPLRPGAAHRRRRRRLGGALDASWRSIRRSACSCRCSCCTR